MHFNRSHKSRLHRILRSQQMQYVLANMLCALTCLWYESSLSYALHLFYWHWGNLPSPSANEATLKNIDPGHMYPLLTADMKTKQSTQKPWVYFVVSTAHHGFFKI